MIPIRFKESVLIQHAERGRLRPQAWHAIYESAAVWEDHGAAEHVITSCLDGQHMATSLHYKGLAVDLRTRTLPTEEAVEAAVSALRLRLGRAYDVVHEPTHIHVEYDPK